MSPSSAGPRCCPSCCSWQNWMSSWLWWNRIIITFEKYFFVLPLMIFTLLKRQAADKLSKRCILSLIKDWLWSSNVMCSWGCSPDHLSHPRQVQDQDYPGLSQDLVLWVLSQDQVQMKVWLSQDQHQNPSNPFQG